jgi:hypothetical protein
MSADNHTFRTDGSPGKQAFESTVDDAVAFFEEAFADDKNWHGPRVSGVLRSCVRTTLTTDGTATPEKIARAARTLDKEDAFESNVPVESVLRRLEAMIGESSDITSSTGEFDQ